MRLIHGAASHVGLVRKQNEDSFVAGEGLYAVCDGMGGARAGEVASETACQTLLFLQPYVTEEAELRRSVAAANDAIVEKSIRDPRLFGMGTTMTAAVGREGGLLLAHVGDSRAYLLRDATLRQVTDDHSLVGEMVRRGQLTPEQAAAHPHRSVITRALGTEREVEVDLIDLDLQEGDRVLFCSDGLSGMVDDDRLAEVLGQGEDPQAVADALVRAALKGGGEDNITAVVVIAIAGDASESGGTAAGAAAVPRFGPERREAETGGTRGAAMSARRALGRMRGRVVVLFAGGAVALLLVLVVAVALFNSSVYFVGTRDGRVALYNGMPYVLFGRELSHVVEVAPTSYAVLDAYVKGRVDAHELTSKEEGQRFIRGLAPSTTTSLPAPTGRSSTTSTLPGSTATTVGPLTPVPST